MNQDVFVDGVSIDDKKPHPLWSPSPEQIIEFAAEIRRGWSDVEHVRRMRVDLRPTVAGADRQQSPVDASDYFCHLRTNERNQQ